MNFVDAAVVLLKEANSPVHVEELCRLALERGLLDSPGSAPLRSFKGRLTTELKRGPESRVVRVEDDLWALSDVASTSEPVADSQTDTDSEAGAATASDSAHDHEHAHDHDHDHALVDDDEDDLDEDDGGEDEDEDDFDDEEEDEADAEAEAEPAAPVEERVLTAEEQALAEVYGDEMDAAPVGALVEYRDAQTADEDRPMTPEMTGERRSRRGHGGAPREDWKARRERMREERRQRREEREKRQTGNRGGQQGQQTGGGGSPPSSAPSASSASSSVSAASPGSPGSPGSIDVESLPAAPPGGGGGDLARRACEVLASIKGGQPVPVKQLAQMMRKRRLIDDDPEKAWRPLKAALLADNQRRAACGLPPRIQYRGRDLFSYRPSGNAELEAVELAIETATQRLRGATERALAARLADLQLGPLEQVAHLYLTQVGWREIDWIKRVDRSGYATAREPGDGNQVLIGVRAGNQEIDRRGVGELRAGVAAKGLGRGLLLAARELGSEARSELEREGAPITVIAGLGWASALAQAGVGVAQRMVPVTYLDGELLDRLAE